jgi:hypothetical protein
VAGISYRRAPFISSIAEYKSSRTVNSKLRILYYG